jgi:CRISPR/Cas system-associated endoribonuclease Cas2
MRSYIFTDMERRVINRFFEGLVTESEPNMAKIKHRVKNYGQLEKDVEVYLKLKERLKQPVSPR